MRTFFLVIFLLSISVNSTIADSDLERSNLSKLASEIDFLIDRVDKIRRTPITNQRLIFNYAYLKSDLLKIRAGINDHLSKSIASGRRIEPLMGDYQNGVHQ